MSPRHKALAALVFICLTWGYNWVLMKEALRFAAPFDFAALRTLPGALLLFAIAAFARQPLAGRAPGSLFLLGMLQTAGFTALTTCALVEGGAGKTAVLTFTMPFWTLLLAWPLLGEKLHGGQWFAVLLAAAGLVLVLEPWSLSTSLRSKVLAVLAGVCWAAAAVLAKRMGAARPQELLPLTAWQMLFGGSALTLVALVVPSPSVIWTPYFGLILAYNIGIGTALNWLLWLYILNRLPAGMASLSVLAIPVIGVLSSRLQLGEQPGRAEVLGMLLIGCAIALLSLLRGRSNVCSRDVGGGD